MCVPTVGHNLLVAEAAAAACQYMCPIQKISSRRTFCVAAVAACACLFEFEDSGTASNVKQGRCAVCATC